jgi:uncharacterized membrane protein
MPFCAACGSTVEGRFCAKCGSSVGAPGGPSPSPAAAGSQQGVAAGAPLADNVASALCYVLWIVTGIIFLVIAPYNHNRTVRFHAFQSIFASIAVFAAEIVLGIVFSMLPFGFWFLWQFVWLAILGLWLYLVISAYQGKQVELPVIGALARQQAGTN